MWRFYLSLLADTPRMLKQSVSSWLDWFAVMVFALVLINPQLASKLSDDPTAGFSRWWSLVPVGLIFLHAILKSNYERFSALKAELDDSRKELVEARAALMPASPQELAGPFVKSRVVRIADALEDNIRIRNKVFEDCLIVGPAVLKFYGGTSCYDCWMLELSVDSNVDVFLWRIAERSTDALTGGISVESCTFRRCQFKLIGFVGPDVDMDQIRTGLLKQQEILKANPGPRTVKP